MIRFCDKNVYTIEKGEMSRSQMLLFFLAEDGAHRRDVLAVVRGDGSYYGIVIYWSVLEAYEVEKCILKDYIVISEDFFEEAERWFQAHPKGLLPVLDAAGELISFCYDDAYHRYSYHFNELDSIANAKMLPVSFFEWQKDCGQIWILGCNELAYQCYCLFRKLQYPVYVEGGEWQYLGVKNEEVVPCIKSEEFRIYAEGCGSRSWNWTPEEKIPDVESNFRFLSEWIAESRRAVYKRMAEFFKRKGIAVCSVQIPEEWDVVHWTFLELQCHHKSVSIDSLPAGKGDERERELLCRIMGKETVEQLYDKGLDTEKEGLRRVSYTNIEQTAVKGLSYREGRIYVIGPCIVDGYGNLLKDTLVFQIQEKVKKEKYLTVRAPMTSLDWNLWTKQELESWELREKDIVIFIDSCYLLEEITVGKKLNLLPIFNDAERDDWLPERWGIQHMNKIGIKAVAETIYSGYLKKEIGRLKEKSRKNNYVQKGEILSAELREKVKEYVNQIQNRTFVRGGGKAVMEELS